LYGGRGRRRGREEEQSVSNSTADIALYKVTSYSSLCLAEQSPQREKFRTQIAEHGHVTKRVRSNADASDLN
jgi:hypothetical protein